MEASPEAGDAEVCDSSVTGALCDAPWWQCIAGSAAGAAASGRRMQCIGEDVATRASATGPTAGTSMTSNKNLAVQRCMVVRLPAPDREYDPKPTSDGEDHNSGWWAVASGHSPAHPLPASENLGLHARQVVPLLAGNWQLDTGNWFSCTISSMHELAERLLGTIRKQEFMRAGDRVAVAVSGGADSVALLLLLLELQGELGIVLSVAHVNHKLRGAESDEDEQFVTKLAAKQGLELETRTAPVKQQGAGIESAARHLRHGYFQELACAGRATRIATAHTLDDQAETVLLRMFRGAGIRGLAGILPRLKLESEGRACGEVVRPLLAFRRAELREYLRARGQDWREDSSNQNMTFLRNRARQRLLPVIAEEFGEVAIEHMAELAEIARAEEDQWSACGAAHPPSSADPNLPVEQLLGLPLAAARRTVRAWIEKNAPQAAISFRLVEEILDLGRGAAGRKLELPGQPAGANEGSRVTRSRVPSAARPRIVRRARDELVLETPSVNARDYEYVLAVPGEVSVPELRTRIVAETVDMAKVPEQHRQELLDPARLEEKIVIRNWRAGDRFWPAHSKQEKKVKELLSDRHATGKEKKLWPVAFCRGELVWMKGFAVPKAWNANSGKAIWIREITD